MVNKPKTVIRTINPSTDPEEVTSIWTHMISLSNHSYFLSWGWLGTWLNTLPEDVHIRLVVGIRDDRPVFAFFYGYETTIRHFFAISRGIFLNATGNSYYDSIFIEYNSVLVDPSYKFSAMDLKDIPLPDWDEFILPGVVLENDSAIKDLFDELQYRRNTVVYIREKTYNVNLQKVRDANNDYFSLLSSNRRQQLRRSIREYEKEGPIEVEPADSLANALEMFSNMVELHQAEWIKRGKPGAFANTYLYKFHTSLIEDRFQYGEIQLLHIHNNKETIGYLYNFVYHRNVLFYQAGFRYKAENKFRPGMVSHYYGIMFNTQRNNLIYDFLAGDSAYKESLSTDFKVMEWIRIQKKRPQFIVENWLKKCKSTIRNMRK